MGRQPGARKTEVAAVEIVVQEELVKGWKPGPLLSQPEQRRQGCDLLSHPPDGGPPHPIEVKGWGESLRAMTGKWNYPAEINAQQLERALKDPNWRLEIVANLSAARNGTGEPERLTLTASEVVERAEPSEYEISLVGLEKGIRDSMT